VPTRPAASIRIGRRVLVPDRTVQNFLEVGTGWKKPSEEHAA